MDETSYRMGGWNDERAKTFAQQDNIIDLLLLNNKLLEQQNALLRELLKETKK